jgi:apolipoprotein N-acyltransferase
MANVPRMVQIADLCGTYGVSFVVAITNVAAFALLRFSRRAATLTEVSAPLAASAVLLAATLAYGHYRLGQPLGDRLATFALVQRSEEVDYGQPIEREYQMFQNYARQTVESVRQGGQAVDAVVWPESMFSGGMPWMIADPNAKVPQQAMMSSQEFQLGVADHRARFLERAGHVQEAVAQVNPSGARPHLVAGCGVVRYRDATGVYSAVVSITPDGQLDEWYGKTHLVMFGEYIPIASSIPGLRSLVPPGLGLQTGPGAKRFRVGSTVVSPNICIETAVERVTVNQLASLLERGEMADAVVTVTNDGWFDDSSVIEHHLRCAQLVAVGCRRPVLSAANNGPTAWIDSRGQIVDRLPQGSQGAVIAAPNADDRTSVYLRIGDWPARLCVFLGLVCLAVRRKPKSQ